MSLLGLEPPAGAIDYLLSEQDQHGYWKFLTTLNDAPVVDATCASLLALLSLRGEASKEVEGAVAKGIDWLEGSQLHDGGWGLIPEAEYRSYTTSMAIEVFAHSDRVDSLAARRAVQRLLKERNAVDGYWCDGANQPSVPTTAESLIALSSIDPDLGGFEPLCQKSVEWLIRCSETTHLWKAGPGLHEFEEVRVLVDGRERRIDYGYSARPLATLAVMKLATDERANAIATLTMQEMVLDLREGAWEAYAGHRWPEPTSWILYDVTRAIANFPGLVLGSEDVCWSDGKRVLKYGKDLSPVRVFLRKHLRKAPIPVVVVVVIVAMVDAFGIVGAVASIGASILWAIYQKLRP
jgi:hypothetical protein